MLDWWWHSSVFTLIFFLDCYVRVTTATWWSSSSTVATSARTSGKSASRTTGSSAAPACSDNQDTRPGSSPEDPHLGSLNSATLRICYLRTSMWHALSFLSPRRTIIYAARYYMNLYLKNLINSFILVIICNHKHDGITASAHSFFWALGYTATVRIYLFLHYGL